MVASSLKIKKMMKTLEAESLPAQDDETARYRRVFQDLLANFKSEQKIKTVWETLATTIEQGSTSTRTAYTLSGLEGCSRALFLTILQRDFLPHHTKWCLIAVTEADGDSEALHADLELLQQYIADKTSLTALTWYPYLESTGTVDVNHELKHAKTRALHYKRLRTEFLLRTPDSKEAQVTVPNITITTSELGLESCAAHKNLKATQPEHQEEVWVLEVGKTLKRETLLSQLQNWGYRRESYANEPGEMACRGDVFEFFGPDYPSPLRCYFFGDEIEALKLLPEPNINSATKSLTSATLSPFVLTKHTSTKEATQMSLSEYSETEGYVVLELHFKALDSGAASNHFHLPILPAQRFRKNLAQTQSVIKRLVTEAKLLYIFTPNPLLIKTLANLLETFELEFILKKDFITSSYVEVTSTASKDKMSEMDKNLPIKITLIEAKISNGFAGTDTYVFTGEEIFGKRLAQRGSFSSGPPENFWETFLELEENDFVVHTHHGIGLYRGIERIRIDDREKDYLKLEYRDQAKIFIPVEQLHLVQKYIGERKQVRINTLGKNNWRKVTARAQKAAEHIAKKLLVLYSKRNSLRVSPLPKEEYFQQLFEMEFPYEESSGQLKCSEEIKNDLEKDVPMDRLLCADVGYGKTEVALRAVFKTALGGRQCLFLAPTTLLSIQHYETFLKRFKNTPIKVALLNRFSSQREFKTILENMRTGHTEVLVGTHKALTKKVKFHKLSLLVIDEEQKFGVVQKETIRKSYPAVHTLSLSATPIPRTLHLSLSALRDLSFISTPITGRIPVETTVMEFDEQIVRKAFQHEKAREGQCYFIYNRVQSLPLFERTLKRIIPEAKILTLHAQMERDVIEQRFHAFCLGEYDVLLATSIIDSGIDLPRVNTLFVYNAHTFGLSQLYQLKGRVGRSSLKAYGYFFYPKETPLTENARNRLHCLERYVELGSGYQIAIKDLELRGAGSLLGIEQSGTLALVGLELFSNLLQEAITKLKHGAIEIPIYYEPIIELSYKAYIPDSYASSQSLKATLYRKIMTAKSARRLDAVRVTLKEEHGTIPEVMTELFEVSAFKIFTKRHKVLSVIEKNEHVELKFLKGTQLQHTELHTLIRKGTIQVRQEANPLTEAESATKQSPSPSSQRSSKEGFVELAQLAGLTSVNDVSAQRTSREQSSWQERSHETKIVLELSPFKADYERVVPLERKISLLKDLIKILVTAPLGEDKTQPTLKIEPSETFPNKYMNRQTSAIPR